MEPLEASERNDAVERFVLNQMDGRELDEFLTRLMFEPALRDEVAVMRERVKTLRGMQRPNPVPASSRRRTMLLLALLVLAAVSFFWLLRPSGAVPAALPPGQPVKQQSNREPVAGQQVSPAESSKPKETPGEELQKAAPRRLIAANFEPNPALEYMIGPGQYRDNNPGGFHWTRAPQTQPVFASRDGKTRFILDVAADAPAKLVSQLQWRVFSNKKTDYDAGRFLYGGQFLAQAAAGNSFTLSVQADLPLRPGLYYYLVEDEEKGDLYFVGKFEVK